MSDQRELLAETPHSVIHYGTKPASATGAMTKSRAEPKMAIAFDMAYPKTPGPPVGALIWIDTRRRSLVLQIKIDLAGESRPFFWLPIG